MMSRWLCPIPSQWFIPSLRRCTQGPGDMLVLPAAWGHATRNHGFNIGIGDPPWPKSRLGSTTSGHHGLHRLHLEAWDCPPHS